MSDRWRLIGEVVGLTAVVGSLVFVGIQIQQGAEATKSSTVLELKNAMVQTNLAYATSIELNEAMEASMENGFENISFVQREMIEGMDRVVLHNIANAYYQYRIGTLDEEQWLPHYLEIESFADYPNMKHTWERWRFLYDVPFQQLVDEIYNQQED